MTNKQRFLIVALVVVLAALSRLVKHPFNFTPVVAMSIFAGAYMQKNWGIFIPLLAMLVSDYFIGFYDWQIMASVYVSIALAFFIGKWLKKHLKWYNVAISAVASSVVFFLVTNFAVWAFFDWYPHTLAGLSSCFTLALPFFRNTLAGDIVYTAILFGAFDFATNYAKSKKEISITTNQ